MELNLLGAFLAGIFIVMAPCTLPILPGYIIYLTGTTKEGQKRSTTFFHGLLFTFGFTVIFTTLGVLTAFIGAKVLHEIRGILTVIGGILIVLLGLIMTGWVKSLKFGQGRVVKVPEKYRGTYFGTFLFGSVFAISWSPCLGPILGSLLTLTAIKATVFEGGLSLFVFSSGFSIPFLIIALAVSKADRLIKRISGSLQTIQIIAGILLILLGLMLVFDKFYLLYAASNWFVNLLGVDIDYIYDRV